MKLPDRYRLLVSSTEGTNKNFTLQWSYLFIVIFKDVEKIANKEFEFETLRFTFKPASEIFELPKR
jgi:hypothetical protein